MSKRRKTLPMPVKAALEKAGSWATELHKVKLTIASQVKQLLSPAAQGRKGGFGRNWLQWSEPATSQVRFVEPGIGLFRQDTGDAFPVQVYPAVRRVLQAVGQIFQAGSIDLLNRFIDNRLAVLEFKRWQGFF